MVELRSISLVITPPWVSTPSESGVTSSRSTSLTSPLSTPAWMAAPIATTSSGFTPLCGSLPKIFRTISITAGIRVCPPTSTTSFTSDALIPASSNAFMTGPRVRSMRSPTSSSSFAQVRDSDRLFALLLVQPIGQRGSRRFVNDAQDLEPCNRARVFGRLALRVVEVGRHGNHSLVNLFAQFGFRIDSHLLQNHGRDFRRTVFAPTQHYTNVPVGGTRDLVGHVLHSALDLGVIELAPHETLNGKNRIFRVGHRLSFRHLADQALTALGDRHDGGCQA